jgi:hypothetical protein
MLRSADFQGAGFCGLLTSATCCGDERLAGARWDDARSLGRSSIFVISRGMGSPTGDLSPSRPG